MDRIGKVGREVVKRLDYLEFSIYDLCLLQEVNRELKRIHIDGCRYIERLNNKTEGSKRLAYTGLRG
jgi:hypothetical protein